MRIKLLVNIVNVFFIMLVLTGCYKKDLEDFKNASEVKYNPKVAVPLIFKYITLDDTIPKLPFYTSVTMSDTATIELPKSKDSAESVIKQVDFKVQLKNTFPFHGIIQVYFTDDNGNIIDSLLNNSQRIMNAGNPVYEKEILISVDKDRYIELTKNSDNMRLYYNVTTFNINGINGSYLLVNIGAIADVSVDLKK